MGGNGKSSTVRYSFSMFRFVIEPSVVYLHCKVHLCTPEDYEPCKPVSSSLMIGFANILCNPVWTLMLWVNSLFSTSFLTILGVYLLQGLSQNGFLWARFEWILMCSYRLDTLFHAGKISFFFFCLFVCPGLFMARCPLFQECKSITKREAVKVELERRPETQGLLSYGPIQIDNTETPKSSTC